MDPIYCEEKVDGSQFSFGKFSHVLGEGDPHAGTEVEELRVRSKGVVFPIDAPPKMFSLACETVKSLGPLLTPGYTYRGEFLGKPKHNTLAYDRIPSGGIILFDVCRGMEDYLSYPEKLAEAKRLGLECVPLLHEGIIDSPQFVRHLFQTKSILGGQNIEGVVFKPVTATKFGSDKKLLLAKFVSEAFKEVHQGVWKQENPSKTDFLETLISAYTTPARWNKAIQHARDAGELDGTPKDIGKLVALIPADIKQECEQEIKDLLFGHFWKDIRRGVLRGFPEFYKQRLLEAQFDDHQSIVDQLGEVPAGDSPQG